MEIFEVGGAVRDSLLGKPVADRDWVVVGATPEAMQRLGYKPVGRDFPVFLHPETHEEYALARTERKNGRGYHGFTFHAAADVTLEEDLARRDLTINAMARNAEGQLFDPFNGQRDLESRTLRHVGPAFSEDPVRILRIARFAARFGDFCIAPETLALMREMVTSGEADHLVAERVWQELSRGLMEASPSRMLDVLRDCGALARLLPEVDRLYGVPQRPDYHPEGCVGTHLGLVLDACARRNLPLPARFAALCHDLGKADTPADVLPRHLGHEQRGLRHVDALCERLRVPRECRDIARIVTRHHGVLHRAQELRAETWLRLFESSDALRRPERFELALAACEADHLGRGGAADAPYPQADLARRALAAARGINAAAIARSAAPQDIPAAIAKARRAAITTTLNR